MSKTLKEKINEYISKCGYTWTYETIMEQWCKYNDGEYISFTAKDVVKKVIEPHYEQNKLV